MEVPAVAVFPSGNCSPSLKAFVRFNDYFNRDLLKVSHPVTQSLGHSVTHAPCEGAPEG